MKESRDFYFTTEATVHRGDVWFDKHSNNALRLLLGDSVKLESLLDYFTTEISECTEKMWGLAITQIVLCVYCLAIA